MKTTFSLAVLVLFVAFLATGCSINYTSAGRNDAARALGNMKPSKYGRGESATVADSYTAGQVNLNQFAKAFQAANQADQLALVKLLASHGVTNMVTLTNFLATPTNLTGLGMINFTNRTLSAESGLAAVVGVQHHLIDALMKIGVAEAEAKAAPQAPAQGAVDVMGGLLTSPPCYGYAPNYGYYYSGGGHNFGGRGGCNNQRNVPTGHNYQFRTR